MNELTFLDLVILKKTDAESSVEKFGSLINTSFFETANLLGTIKIKGYIDIESSVGGISKVTVTEAGKGILLLADQKATGPIEPIDNAILQAVASGAKEPESLQSQLNVRSGDLAYHLNKLVSQGYLDYSVRSAHASFMLTEQGFNSTGGVRVPKTDAQPEEIKPEQRATAGTVAPPWVKPSAVAPREEKKEDVSHLLSEEQPAKHKEQHKLQPHQKKPLSMEEQKRAEKHRRMMSKLEYYVVEYMPYMLLVVVVGMIFLAAIILALTKF